LARISKRRVREVLAEKNGVITQVAEALAVTRQTVYNYLDKYQLWDDLERDRQRLLTLAVNNIAAAVEKGDVDTSKWVASRLGREQGWNEKIDVEGTMLPLSPEALKNLERLGLDVSEVVRQFESMLAAQAMKARGKTDE
jgi:predicted transcriptional regulator